MNETINSYRKNCVNCLSPIQCTQIVERLERLSIAKEEYFLLKALVLANSDVRLDQFNVLKKFRDTILSALADCVLVVR